jgi:Tol biopolymer transport system component
METPPRGTTLLLVGLLAAPAVAADEAPALVFSRSSGEGVDVVAVSTARPRRVVALLTDTGDNWYPRAAVSPDGRYLAYVTDQPLQRGRDFTAEFGNGAQLMLYDSRRDELTHLDHGGFGADRPAFSPDGDYLAFDRQDADGDWDIYRLDLDDGSPQPLSDEEVFEEAAAFSPDGRAIVYCAGELEALQLQYLDLVSGERRTLTKGGVSNLDPAFSPDGAAIVYARREGGETDLYVMGLSGDAGARRVADLPGDQRYPRFSPDGEFIAFATYYPDGGSDIYLIDARGWGPPVRVTSTLARETYPAWIELD